jgi:hypothetical protein
MHRCECVTAWWERGAQDPDAIPFCDWMEGMDLSTLDTGSCSRIPDVLCSDEGDVLELHLSARALEGTIPASFASLTALRKVELNKNKCVSWGALCPRPCRQRTRRMGKGMHWAARR